MDVRVDWRLQKKESVNLKTVNRNLIWRIEKKQLVKKEQNPSNLWENIQKTIIYIIYVPEEEETKNWEGEKCLKNNRQKIFQMW